MVLKKMIERVISVMGRVMAGMPLVVGRGLAWVGGMVVYVMRRRLIMSNLVHAFPERGLRELRKVGKESCRRMVEMGLFSLASPYFSRKRIEEMLEPDETFLEFYDKYKEGDRPHVLLIPHLSMSEGLTLMPAIFDIGKRETGIIYRPLNNRVLDEYVKRTRERFGVRLLSRKDGFNEARGILRRNGIVGVLFDQNAGRPGTLTTFFGRLASTTHLPEILGKDMEADFSILYTERVGFWKSKVKVKFLRGMSSVLSKQVSMADLGVSTMLESSLSTVSSGSVLRAAYKSSHINQFEKNASKTAVAILGNEWLEGYLREDDNHCADWLWFHNRWGTQNYEWERFRLEVKRGLLDEENEYYGRKEIPRKTRYFFRMPNWLGDVMMALPLIRALRKSRPDAEITLLVQGQFVEFLKALGVAERVIGLPKKSWRYFFECIKYRELYPDVYYLFTNSLRGDLEARIIGAPERLSILRRGKRRPFLTQVYRVPGDLEEGKMHQTGLWERAFRTFGLEEELDLEPFKLVSMADLDVGTVLESSLTTVSSGSALRSAFKSAHINQFRKDSNENGGGIGIICGTENSPEKRWPVERWRELIEEIGKKYPGKEIKLFGTKRDEGIVERVISGIKNHNIINLCGKTSLVEFCRELKGCDVVISNDTGGVHLGNGLGVGVIVIFGPTNAVRTGPVYRGYVGIVMGDGASVYGGGDISLVSVEKVLRKLEEYFSLGGNNYVSDNQKAVSVSEIS